MKKRILSIIKELNIATKDEIGDVLTSSSGSVNKNILESNIKQLENDMSIFKILSSENCLDLECYISGPNFEPSDSVEIKKVIVDMGLFKKDMNSIYWEKFSKRCLKKLIFDIEELKENIIKRYKEPKKLEIDYFDLSLKYHALYGYFFDKYEVGFLSPANELLEECKGYLDKLDF